MELKRDDVATRVAAELACAKGLARKAVDAVVSAIQEALAAGDKVTLTGFGAFDTRIQAPRTGRNPANGEPLSIPEKRVVKFKAGRELKAAAERAEGRRAA